MMNHQRCWCSVLRHFPPQGRLLLLQPKVLVELTWGWILKEELDRFARIEDNKTWLPDKLSMIKAKHTDASDPIKKATGGTRVTLGEFCGLAEDLDKTFGFDFGGGNCFCFISGEFWAGVVESNEGDGALLVISGSSSVSETLNDPIGGSMVRF